MCLDLLQKMLVINPEKRITVEEALSHPYFAELHNPEEEPVCDRIFKLHINDETITKEDLRVGFLLSIDFVAIVFGH